MWWDATTTYGAGTWWGGESGWSGGALNGTLGAAAVGVQAFNAWNSYKQGKEQLRLARETLDFNKTQAKKENERYDEQKRQRDEAHAKISSAADVWNTPSNNNVMTNNTMADKKDELMPMERA